LKRFAILALVLTGLGIVASLNLVIATGPALGLTAAAAWLARA
jgi:hypothetical protein